MKIAIITLVPLIMFSGLQACVTYHPSSNIYTIDASGSVTKIPVKR